MSPISKMSFKIARKAGIGSSRARAKPHRHDAPDLIVVSYPRLAAGVHAVVRVEKDYGGRGLQLLRARRKKDRGNERIEPCHVGTLRGNVIM